MATEAKAAEGRKLTVTTILRANDGSPVVLRPGDVVPAEYADQAVGDHLYAEQAVAEAPAKRRR